jgi:hypothetical protein
MYVFDRSLRCGVELAQSPPEDGPDPRRVEVEHPSTTVPNCEDAIDCSQVHNDGARLDGIPRLTRCRVTCRRPNPLERRSRTRE